jgi:multiple sugar transport system permease protein
MWGTGTIMAATLLVILPLIILYIFTQRYFVESIERTGLID